VERLPPRRASLVMGDRRVSDAVDDGGLGRAEGDPIRRQHLHLAKEILRARLGLLMHRIEAMELGLEGELAGEGGLELPAAPDGDGRLGPEAMAEIEGAR